MRALFIPLLTAGHINPVIGFATALKQRNHDVTFVTDRAHQGKFKSLGFNEEIVESQESTTETSSDHLSRFIASMASSFRNDPYDAIGTLVAGFNPLTSMITRSNERIGEIIQDTKPDVIVCESYYWHPAVLNSGIPMVQLLVGHTLGGLESEGLPPSLFGLSTRADPSTWEKYIERKREAFQPYVEEYTKYMVSMNAPLPRRKGLMYISSNLNIFFFPASLVSEYTERSAVAKHWIGVDIALRPSDTDFQLPDKLASRPGKLVYLSMGSMASSDVELMKTMIGNLSDTPYRVIVSAGPRKDELELPENMWGDKYVPQLGVLPLVDLAIIHGGNNTFLETLYFGKPMIIIPLFADQHDNAQLAVDTTVGVKFNPFRQTKEELLELMEKVMNDEEMAENVRKVSREMHESKSMDHAVDRVEFVAKSPKIPTVI